MEKRCGNCKYAEAHGKEVWCKNDWMYSAGDLFTSPVHGAKERACRFFKERTSDDESNADRA